MLLICSSEETTESKNLVSRLQLAYNSIAPLEADVHRFWKE